MARAEDGRELVAATNPDGSLIGSATGTSSTQVQPAVPRSKLGTSNTTISNTTETTIIAAVASEYHDITSIVISNTSASAVRVDLRDDTGGTVIAQFMVPASDTRGAVYAVPRAQTAANKNWTAQLSSAVTDVRISTQYLKNTA